MIDAALELAWRELAILLVLGLLGSGASAYLPGPLPAAARLALAPAFGLALGAGLTLSASQLMPMSTASWVVLLPAAFVSAALTLRLARRAPTGARRLPRAHVLWAAVALIVPAAALDAPLVEQRTPGPIGYSIADAAAYSEQSFVLHRNTWDSTTFDPRLDAGAATRNRFLHDFYTGPVFQTGTAPLQAALNETFGWHAIDSQSAMVVFLVTAGALGCFAFLLTLTGIGWVAAVGGLLYAGPVVYQLHVESGQSALAGLALIGPLALTANRLGAAPVPAGLLFGVLAGGLATVYPSYVPTLAGAGALTLAAALLRRRIGPTEARPLALACACAAAAAVAVAPVAIAKDVRYARAVSDGMFDKSDVEAATGSRLQALKYGRPVRSRPYRDSLPHWDRPAAAAPAWISGSRDIYYLPTKDQTSSLRWLTSDLLYPALILALAALGALRFPPSRTLLAAAGAALVVAGYSLWSQDCEYCSQRNLLPLAPIAALLTAAGLASLAVRLRPKSSLVGFAPALLALLVVAVPAQRDWALAQRLEEGGSAVGADLRAVLEVAASRNGPIAIEGTGAGPPAVAGIEGALLQTAVAERLRRPAVVDWKSLPSFHHYPGDPPRNSDLDAGYRLVLTRIAGVATPRETVLRRGPYALQRRAPTDVLVSFGAEADLVQRDPRGQAWLSGPLALAVATGEPGPVYLRLALRGPAAPSLRAGGGTVVLARGGRSVRLCARVTGGALRRKTLRLGFRPLPHQPSPDRYGRIPVADKRLRLVSLAAGSRRCR